MVVPTDQAIAVQRWMEDILGRRLVMPIHDAIRTPSMLCTVLNILSPGAVVPLPTEPAAAAEAFSRALLRYGIPASAICSTSALLQGDWDSILSTLRAIARRGRRDGFPELLIPTATLPPSQGGQQESESAVGRGSLLPEPQLPTPAPALPFPRASLNPFLDDTPTSPLPISFEGTFPTLALQPPASQGGFPSPSPLPSSPMCVQQRGAFFIYYLGIEHM